MFSVQLTYALRDESNTFLSSRCHHWIRKHLSLPEELKVHVDQKFLFHGPSSVDMAQQVCHVFRNVFSHEHLEQGFIQAEESGKALYVEDIHLVNGRVFSKLMQKYNHLAVIAATLELEDVEPLILRCFNYQCFFDYPLMEERREYLKFLLETHDHRVDVSAAAERCLKYSYRDLKHVVDTGVLNRLSDGDPILRDYHLNFKPTTKMHAVLKKLLPLTKNLLFRGQFAFMALDAFHLSTHNSVLIKSLPASLHSHHYVVIINLEHFKEIDILKLLERCVIDNKIVVASFTSHLSSDILSFFDHTVVIDKKLVC